jgi:NhaA family Na+:H+ antiporter
MTGELSSRSRALLPAIAAIGGMVVPALMFWFINQGHPENMAGWAIPAATDIAFALGVLALLGDRVPVRLKILLTAVAIIDDLLAILIIAFFYTANLDLEPLYFGVVALVGMVFLNQRHVSSPAPYIILGIILWIAVLKSGVHATLAGVVTALFIPMTCPNKPDYSPCEKLEHALHPWVAFIILPVFAFANAGISFKGMKVEALYDPLTLGIIAGLVIGKQLGIFSMLFLTIKSGLSPMPKGVNWTQLYAVSVLCGVGFTMSLFVGSLAFETDDQQVSIRLGVLIASILSGLLGYILLRLFSPSARDTAEQVSK